MYSYNSGQWKFNKILQTWALDNCFDKKKIDVTLFKVLMPYLLSIKVKNGYRIMISILCIAFQACLVYD
jgi:hypothetical protein